MALACIALVAPAPAPAALDDGPGGPILVVKGAADEFGGYYAEILRNEGLNSFDVADLAAVTPSMLAAHDVVVLGETALSPAQVTMLADWVDDGGNLIAMRPDADLAGLLGLSPQGGTVSEGYVGVDPSMGVTTDTMQFHGTADRWALAGADEVASLFSTATTDTGDAAVTLRSVGANGGQAAAFAYDLARSVVYTRQGNPAWAGQERDGQSGPIRPDDLFFPDWIDLDKVAIPQADEQQRLLANLIGEMNADRAPLPRFWYFPRGEKAVVVMTGDDHGTNGTEQRFDDYLAASTPGCDVAKWECIRGTSYVYPGTVGAGLTPAEAAAYEAQGFEVALHVDTGCANLGHAGYDGVVTSQLSAFASAYPSVATPTTNRNHCIAWDGWTDTAEVEEAHGIRLDTNYYYWPGSWLLDRPGMFTGSGMPMRFAGTDGAMLDVYQATTQMTDESGQSFPATINALLDKATGAQGYYGAFTANMHTDPGSGAGSPSIIASAQAHDVPVITARQLLTWTDARNASSFSGISASGNTLSFDVDPAAGAAGLQAMVPATTTEGELTTLERNGSPVSFSTRTVKGVSYAFVDAVAGSYEATYEPAPPAPSGLTDTTTTDFSAGSGGVKVGDGEITLPPTIDEAFGGPGLPAGWESGTWESAGGGSGGSATVSGTGLTVDGAYAATTSTYGPGRRLEFDATFGTNTFQHAGFGVDLNNVADWAMFSTNNDGSQLWARSNSGAGAFNTPLGISPAAQHHFRIDWNASSIAYYVDGVLVATHATAISTLMRPIVSDFNAGGSSVTIDNLTMSPYVSPGTFTSRVLDAGSAVDWSTLVWDADGDVAFEYRTGDTPTPDGTWSAWNGVPASGDAISGHTRYVQYRATLTTPDASATPVVREVTVTYGDATAPDTIIDSGPSGATTDHSPSFGFHADEPGATFECRLDAGAWTACTSPKAYAALADGPHTFDVRATDAGGNVDLTPASRSFTLSTPDTTAPQTTIDSGPTGTITVANASFAFSADETATFECRLDGGGWSACTSPKSYGSLADGPHTFEVRATDTAGNVDATPASRSFTVDTGDHTAPQTTIDSGPSGTITVANASFAFHADETATFECRLDAGGWSACTSPKAYAGLANGAHTFEVRATDTAGNVDATPASRAFTVAVPSGSGPEITINRPWQGARYSHYSNDKPAHRASYSCTGAVTCTAEVDGDAVADGAPFPRPNPSPADYVVKTFTVTATDGDGNTSTQSITYRVYTFRTLIEELSPIAYWRLNDGFGADTMAALAGPDGEYKNNQDSEPWGISGDGDSSRWFSGADGYAYVNGITAPRRYTMSVFFNIEEDDTSGMIMQHGGAGAIWYDGDRLHFRPVDWDQVELTSPDLGAQKWHHVAASFGSGVAKLYLDGELVDQASSAKQTSGTSTLYLGYGDKAPWLRGRLDEAAYFGSVLDVDQINQIWLADPPPVKSGDEAAAPADTTPVAATIPAATATAADPVAVASKPAAAPARVGRASVRKGVLTAVVRCAGACSGTVRFTVRIGGKRITVASRRFTRSGRVAIPLNRKAKRKLAAAPKTLRVSIS